MLLGQMVALAVYYMYFIFLVPVKQVRHWAACLADIIASNLVPRDSGNKVELHLQSDLYYADHSLLNGCSHHLDSTSS